jgi:hypothetical protein
MASGDGLAGDEQSPVGKDAEEMQHAGEAAAVLRERYDELCAIDDQIETVGEARVEAAADAYREAHRVLDQYEENAVGTGDFGSYLEFEGRFADAVAVDTGAFGADAFAAADEAVDKRRLTERDFAAAREALEPASEAVALLEEREEAVSAFREARKAAEDARDTLADRLEELRAAASMADADVEADRSRLREPVDAYNEAVQTAVESALRERSAREVFDFLERADATPFVDVDLPPADLRSYADEHDAGTEPIPTLLEYAAYSNSKLDHYVADPGALRTAVAVHRTYLDRIDAEPLTLSWPPAPGEELPYEIDELIPLVSRIADDETVATLRELRSFARTDEYDRLRRAAAVRDALDDRDYELVASGAVDDRVADAEQTLEIIDAVLEETDRG